MKIISGGQTGVDRAALDVALQHGIECGGWCPAGRLDELGRIPEKYPLTEMPASTLTGASRPPLPGQGEARVPQHGGEGQQASVETFAGRTLQNVIDSDATVIFFDCELRGGSEFTLRCCREHSRPHLLIDSSHSIEDAANAIVDLTRAHKIDILNVAGPRASEWPNGYDYVRRVLEAFLGSRP